MTNQERKEIGQKIKNFRLDELGMGLSVFAKFLGIKTTMLADIEHGRLAYEQELEQLARKAVTTGNKEDLQKLRALVFAKK